MSLVAKIVYPAAPPSPPAPVISQIVAGTNVGRVEHYELTYVTPDGESLAGAEGSLYIQANCTAFIQSPAYPYPFAGQGYNVYGAAAPGEEVLQNASAILPAVPWIEPITGLITGTATPPATSAAATLRFGRYSFPTKVPAYQRSAVRHDNVAASGVLETIYEHTDYFTEINIQAVEIGSDVDAWNAFLAYAEQGGIFSFYRDETLPGFINYTYWDAAWDAAYKAPGFYTFKMKWRKAVGVYGSRGGAMVFSDAEIPVDSGDHQNFTLANAPNPAASLILILKGTSYYNQPLLAGFDYTLSGASFRLNSALAGTWELRAWYRY